MYRVLGADGKEYGPVSAEQIRQWIIERRLTSNSLVQTQDSPGWRPLTMFPEFAATFGSVASAPLPTSMQGTSMPRTNTAAMWGLGLSCFSLVCCGCGVTAVLGIVFSCIGLSEANRDPAQTGRPIAIAGIVVGIIALLGTILAVTFGAFGEIWEKIFQP
ncbi:MAG TPA: DUF4190 domain-containing protein [Candidatus Acidoferrum sp.]|nr:DUF4190 domain-containing protein [Candidatus Acidoferrum sp.]